MCETRRGLIERRNELEGEIDCIKSRIEEKREELVDIEVELRQLEGMDYV